MSGGVIKAKGQQSTYCGPWGNNKYVTPPALLNPVDFSLHKAPVLQHACIFALFVQMYAPVTPE